MNQAIKDVIAAHNRPDLALEDGMVYQVWEDGEVTLQKSGRLLNQRGLHMIIPGNPAKAIAPDLMPERNKLHGWMYTTEEGARAFRAALGF